MVNDKEIVESIHINLHGIRLVSGYKPSEFESNINKLIIERFKDTCQDCKDRYLLKQIDKENKPKEGFLTKLRRALK